ncbi:MAG: isochorismatase family protein [Actinomycetota bacterium]|nr:isochorismatase family protein [Actinomycetota bacterium]
MRTAHPTFGPTTALLVVDVQNDFADPAGRLYVAGGESVVDVVDGLVPTARAAGSPVVYTQDWHPPETPHFATSGGPWPVHCVAGTWGAQLHPRLEVAGPVVRKGAGAQDGYSGFTARDVETGEERDTGLRRLLSELGVTRVVVVGLALDVCVKETALDARRLGYQTVVVVAATRPVDLAPGDGARALEELRGHGVETC